MSFILDALKKSEMERQRQSLPGLMDTRASPRRSRLPLWAAGLGLLLLVNLLVLTFVLWHKSAPTARATTPAAALPAHNADVAPPLTNHFSPLDAAPVYAPEIPVATADRPSAPVSPVSPVRSGDAGRSDGSAGSTERAPHHADPVLIDEDAQSDNQEVLPTISEISLSGTQTLPELHLDVHVYATKPAERFVYINMRKYHEGATLQEGPRLERIRRDGVVLNYQGVRFLLPRQP
jgi:general secretion pathway protein B